MSKSADKSAAKLHTAQVVVNYGRQLLVETDSKLIPALTRGRKIKPICGDIVNWSEQPNGKAVIESIQERSSVLKRHDVRLGSRELAANVDILFVVMAAEPPTDLALLDRYLVAGEALNLDLHLVFNKTDLLTPAKRAHWNNQMQGYLDLGYPLHWTDAMSKTGIKDIEAVLAERCGILVGASGVGKSSLIRTLVPDHAPRTQALSAASGQGQHTTTATRLYRLPEENGGCIIDSPGVRDFRIWQIPLDELANCYREFRPALGNCRFSNCRHLKEPDCAVKDAVQEGRISPQRYSSYELLSEHMQNPKAI